MTEFMPIEVGKPFIDPVDNHLKVNVSATIGKGSWLFSINNLLRDGSLFKTAMRNSIKWSIITTDNSVPIPTCDNPVVIAEIDNNGNLLVASNGIYAANKFILFPLSPNKVLFGSKKRTIKWRETANRKDSLIFKKLISYNALLEIYSNIEDVQIPMIRERTVDPVEFNRIKKELQNWHEKYKQSEGQYHANRKNTIKTDKEV